MNQLPVPSWLRRLLLPALATAVIIPLTQAEIASGMDLPDGVRPTLRERAWSSPIWYDPA